MYLSCFRVCLLLPCAPWLLFVMFNCVFVTFLCGILGEVWYLIVSIPDLCHLSYFKQLLYLTINSDFWYLNLEKALRVLWYRYPCFSSLEVKKVFLLLKSSTSEHTLAKRISC